MDILVCTCDTLSNEDFVMVYDAKFSKQEQTPSHSLC